MFAGYAKSVTAEVIGRSCWSTKAAKKASSAALLQAFNWTKLRRTPFGSAMSTPPNGLDPAELLRGRSELLWVVARHRRPVPGGSPLSIGEQRFQSCFRKVAPKSFHALSLHIPFGLQLPDA